MSLLDNVKENVGDLVNTIGESLEDFLQNTFADAKEYFTNLDRDDLKQLLRELKNYVPEINQEEFEQFFKDIQSTIGEKINPDRLKEILQNANLNLENMNTDAELNKVVEYVKNNYGEDSGSALQVKHYNTMLCHWGRYL